METVGRFFEAPKSSFFLFGPRGTGKSTWLRGLPDTTLWIDLLQPDDYRAYAARPERLIERVATSPRDTTVVVDEVQRVPELLPAVHHLMEREPEPGRRFVLTGSSARKLRRRGVNLLAGRAVLRGMHPFMAAELGDRFELEAALRDGLVPLVWDAADPGDTLSGYSTLYLREEVQAEGLVRNLGDFARFLEAAALSHGTVLNVSNVARECEVPRKRVDGYLSVLEDLLLAFRVPVFTRRARRATSSKPKWYLFDAGVFRSLRPHGPLDPPAELSGAALEGLVAQHLRAWIDYGHRDHELFFWRTQAGSEVDFVVYGPASFVACEVKSTRVVRPADLRALRAFASDYPECRPLLLYRGRDRLLRDGVLCLPVEEFLVQLRPGRAVDAGL